MKFFLIDGSSFLYRAYYAFPSMNDQEGHNINVVYGFFRMLMKIFQEKPDYFVITWDSPVKTLRHEEYSEYKANRKKMDAARRKKNVGHPATNATQANF